MSDTKPTPVYTKFEKDFLSRVPCLLATLRYETRPIPDHTDPGAIQDCWNSVIEMVNCMVAQLEEPKKKVNVLNFSKSAERIEMILDVNLLGIDPTTPYPHKFVHLSDYIEKAINLAVRDNPGILTDKAESK